MHHRSKGVYLCCCWDWSRLQKFGYATRILHNFITLYIVYKYEYEIHSSFSFQRLLNLKMHKLNVVQFVSIQLWRKRELWVGFCFRRGIIIFFKINALESCKFHTKSCAQSFTNWYKGTKHVAFNLSAWLLICILYEHFPGAHLFFANSCHCH